MSEDNCDTQYYPDGKIQSKSWLNDKNELHRLNGPAYILWRYYNNNIVRKESYHIEKW